MTPRRLRARYESAATQQPPPPPPPPPPEPAANAGLEFPDWMHPERRAAEPEAAAPAAEPAPSAPPAAAGERAPARGLRAFVLLLALALFAFGTGLWLFNSLVMPRLIHGISQAQVPDVRNLTLDQAEQALRATDLQLSRAGERFDPTVPRGFVLSQDPSPGTTVRGRKRVLVIVSLGEEFSSVPELFGESQRSAEQLIHSAGLKLGAITRAPSDEVGDGLVAGSDPGPESVLPQGSAVDLLISTGSGEESVVMPDLLGREVGGVRRQLEALGFRVRVTGGASGTVIAQRPSGGSRITRDTEIDLQATGRVIR
jgi:eukaryotic-like serine/threonine-protein kinase